MNRLIQALVACGLTLLIPLSLIAANSAPKNTIKSPKLELQHPAQQTSPIWLAFASDDAAQCLADCKKNFDSCSDNGTKNIPECAKKRKECIDKCK